MDRSAGTCDQRIEEVEHLERVVLGLAECGDVAIGGGHDILVRTGRIDGPAQVGFAGIQAVEHPEDGHHRVVRVAQGTDHFQPGHRLRAVTLASPRPARDLDQPVAFPVAQDVDGDTERGGGFDAAAAHRVPVRRRATLAEIGGDADGLFRLRALRAQPLQVVLRAAPRPGEIARRGVVDVLRKGVKHGPAAVTLFYGAPSPGNVRATELHAANLFSVTRQLRYSLDETQRALDLCLFINGLPVITFELKNRLTKQTVQDAIAQYQRDRDPRELLFQFGRCALHLAVDDQEVWMCTHLQGADSWFLPFNQGYLDGAGNPPNPRGLKTDYLWREVLTRASLTDILENYCQLVQASEAGVRKKSRRLIWPRYHQLDAVRKLLAD